MFRSSDNERIAGAFSATANARREPMPHVSAKKRTFGATDFSTLSARTAGCFAIIAHARARPEAKSDPEEDEPERADEPASSSSNAREKYAVFSRRFPSTLISKTLGCLVANALSAGGETPSSSTKKSTVGVKFRSASAHARLGALHRIAPASPGVTPHVRSSHAAVDESEARLTTRIRGSRFTAARSFSAGTPRASVKKRVFGATALSTSYPASLGSRLRTLSTSAPDMPRTAWQCDANDTFSAGTSSDSVVVASSEEEEARGLTRAPASRGRRRRRERGADVGEGGTPREGARGTTTRTAVDMEVCAPRWRGARFESLQRGDLLLR